MRAPVSNTSKTNVVVVADASSEPDASEMKLARDRISQAYLGHWGGEETTERARRRIHWIGSQVTGEKVLDIGCSEGILAVLLAREGFSVLGIDVNSDALGYADHLLKSENEFVQSKVEFVHGDVINADLTEGCFDTVVLGEVLEHVLQPELMLERAFAYLKPGGVFVMTTPFGVMPDPDHKQTFSLSDIKKLLQKRGSPKVFMVNDGYISVVVEKSESSQVWQEFDESYLLRETEKGLFESQSRLYSRLKSQSERLEASWEGQAKLKQTIAAQTIEIEDGARRMRENEGEMIEVRDRLRDNLNRYFLAGARVEQLETEKNSLKQQVDGLKVKLRNVRSSSGGLDAKDSSELIKLREELVYQRFYSSFEDFKRAVEQSDSEYFVFMFSGTTFIQKLRANRPIRLTKIMRQMGVPVLFNYHRWRNTDELPPYEDQLLFQSPIDYTQKLLGELAQFTPAGKKCIFVVSYPHPSIAKILNRFNAQGWLTIYDCRDDWEEFEKVGMAKWFKSAIEKYVVKNCDAVCCVSSPLQKKMQEYDQRKRVELLPNGYDPNFLSPDYEREPSSPPKIGYFGHLTSAWFDWDTLRSVALARPSYTFEIIGHGAADDLDLPPNVNLLGPKVHEEICQIAREWSVAIICFKIGKLADGVDPIKIYEYLGLGLPVVSLRMPQIDDYPYTQTADTVSEYTQAIDKALDMKIDKEALDTWLAENTWDCRATRMLEMAREVAGKKKVEKMFHS